MRSPVTRPTRLARRTWGSNATRCAVPPTGSKRGRGSPWSSPWCQHASWAEARRRVQRRRLVQRPVGRSDYRVDRLLRTEFALVNLGYWRLLFRMREVGLDHVCAKFARRSGGVVDRVEGVLLSIAVPRGDGQTTSGMPRLVPTAADWPLANQ